MKNLPRPVPNVGMRVDADYVQAMAGQLLRALEIPENSHTANTGKRFAKMLIDLTSGYGKLPFEFTTFPRGDNDEMIVVSNIPFFSLCAHHLAPFFGVAHVGYVPNKLLVGLSKIPRTVLHFAHKLQVQEDLTTEICNFLVTRLKPLGVAVNIRARHLCTEMRGVRSIGQETSTMAIRGVFKKVAVRAEFMESIRGKA